jgi:hypothetical protein
MTISVIGAGLARTGTTSLKLALEQIGFRPCYHTEVMAANPAHVALWERAFDGKPDWEAIFTGFRAGVSGPTNYFFRELADYYPNAKVILTLRDAERWYASITSTIYADDVLSAMMRGPGAQLMRKVFQRAADLHSPDKARMIVAFEDYNAKVRATIPAERLLVYDVSDGWEPLCRFLGVAIPATPYPHANDAKSFKAQWAQMSGSLAR